MSSWININKNQTEFVRNFKNSNFEKINIALKPDYYNLFMSLSRVKDGVQTMVKMRETLLNTLEEKSMLYKIFMIF